MIYYVNGEVTVLEPGFAVIDCNGVGYGCAVTAYTAAQGRRQNCILRKPSGRMPSIFTAS